MFVTGLSLFTIIAIPSYANTVSTRPLAFSSSFRALEDRPISHLPSLTAVIPLPEPVGLYVKLTPSLLFMNDSPRAPITFSIDVEPSVETDSCPDWLPPFTFSSSVLVFPEQATKLSITSNAKHNLIIFFISFLHRFPYSYYFKTVL